jgi:putative chitinase
MNQSLQREIRLRNALRNALGAWVADTAGETGSKEVYQEAEAAIKESEDAEKGYSLLDAQLKAIMPNLPAGKRATYLPFMVQAMGDHLINTPLRAAAFLAQLAHESAELKYMEEIWGPTAQQKKYEPPHGVARNLGNTLPGDGYRFRGRGPIQLTGRSNYKKYGELLGVDLVNNPDLAAKPEFAFQTAALYWNLNKCNEFADVKDFKAITRAINGGYNGLADRERYYEIAKNALGVSSERS